MLLVFMFSTMVMLCPPALVDPEFFKVPPEMGLLTMLEFLLFVKEGLNRDLRLFELSLLLRSGTSLGEVLEEMLTVLDFLLEVKMGSILVIEKRGDII